jgi:sigma-B regulation protein RsbU (phosphoserine phosphatase)
MTPLFVPKGDPPADPELARLREENQRLHRAVEELSVLNEIALAINSTMAPEGINELIVSKCVKRLGVTQGTIHLFGATEEDPTKTLVRVSQPGTGVLPMRLGIQLTGWMMKNRRPLVINDLAKDERFGGVDVQNLPIKSVLSVPLELKGRLIGILNLFNKIEGEITTEDARLAAIIASQCAQVIENARLYTEEQRLQQLQEDMHHAATIQQMLLPREAPAIPNVDLAGLSVPAREVGGDYFDYIDLGDGRWGIAVGDVSGKGMSAALLMANLQATMRGCARIATSVADCVTAVNRLLLASTDTRTFVTLFYGVFDAQARTFTYCNAGHNPPYRLSPDGRLQTLTTGGPLAAAFAWSRYEEETLTLEPGEILLVYTDGVTEAADATDEQFGEPRLEEIVRSGAKPGARALLDRIVAAVLAFQGDAPVADDLTLVCLRA